MTTYGLIGHPLGHSFSRQYFAEKFRNEGIDAQYLNFDIADIACLEAVIESQKELRGFNVTIPYKQQVMPMLHWISPEAAEIGAVNTVRVVRLASGTRLEGFNTDAEGFRQSILPMLAERHKKALVLGTGGASKAVVYVLRKLGLGVLQVSRHPQAGMIGYGSVSASVMEEYKVVVNCTPVGMFPNVHDCPILPYSLMDSGTVAFDLVYNPTATLFLRRAEQAGAAIKNGLEMLHLQAEAAWRIWNNEELRQ